MKYDVEYDSYRFSNDDMRSIVSALYFYHQHSPNLDDDSRDYVLSLVNSLEKTKNVPYKQPS
jgi:hypothetical protein